MGLSTRLATLLSAITLLASNALAGGIGGSVGVQSTNTTMTIGSATMTTGDINSTNTTMSVVSATMTTGAITVNIPVLSTVTFNGTAQPVTVTNLISTVTFVDQQSSMTITGVLTGVIPGVGATNLGKAEDAAHVDGDTGVLMLGITNNSRTVRGGADGDYEGIALSSHGYVMSSGLLTQTYVAVATAVASAASKDYITLYNAASSSVVLRVEKIMMSNDENAAVTGIGGAWDMIVVTSSGATCTNITARLIDTANIAVSTSVFVTSTCTTDPAVSWNMGGCAFATEESAAGAQTFPCYDHTSDRYLQPLTLRAGQGVSLKTTGLAPGGVVSISIFYTQTAD